MSNSNYMNYRNQKCIDYILFRANYKYLEKSGNLLINLCC